MAVKPFQVAEERRDEGSDRLLTVYIMLLLVWLVATNLMFRALAGEAWVTASSLWSSGAGTSAEAAFAFKLGTLAVVILGALLAYNLPEPSTKVALAVVCLLDLLVLLMAAARAAGCDDLAVPVGPATFTLPVAMASLIIQSPLEVVQSGIAALLSDPFWSFVILFVRYQAWRRIVG